MFFCQKVSNSTFVLSHDFCGNVFGLGAIKKKKSKEEKKNYTTDFLKAD